MKFTRIAGCAAAITVTALVPSGEADACSLPEMPDIEDVLPGEPIRSLATGPVLGIYEIEHIAYAGWLGSERSRTPNCEGISSPLSATRC